MGRRSIVAEVFVEIGMWKKLFKGWTVSFEVWSEAARWTEERRNASRRRGAGEQVDIGIGAERLI